MVPVINISAAPFVSAYGNASDVVAGQGAQAQDQDPNQVQAADPLDGQNGDLVQPQAPLAPQASANGDSYADPYVSAMWMARCGSTEARVMRAPP